MISPRPEQLAGNVRPRRFAIEPLEDRIAPGFMCLMPCHTNHHMPTFGIQAQFQFQAQFQSQSQSQSQFLFQSITINNHTFTQTMNMSGSGVA
jgi:hypothetical protein